MKVNKEHHENAWIILGRPYLLSRGSTEAGNRRLQRRSF